MCQKSNPKTEWRRSTIDDGTILERSNSSSMKKATSIPPHAQSVALVLVVFTYFRRLGTTSSNHAIREKWMIPSLIVFIFLLRTFFRSNLRSIFDKFLPLIMNSSSTMATIRKATSSETLSGLSRVSSTDAIRRLSTSIRNSFTSHKQRRTLQAITATECFARLDYIEQLTVYDIAILYQYATLVNQPTFEKNEFQASQNRLLRSMITAIDMAVLISRGAKAMSRQQQHSRPTQKDQHHHQVEQMDALYFVAVTRIFAEWRGLRLVPPGYKRYALSMNLAQGDMLQNLSKMEAAVHAYIHFHTTAATSSSLGSDDDVSSTLASPTIRQLLEYEAQQVHERLPKLENPSGAVGLLWIVRQVQYQELCFANMINVPSTDFPTPKDAALAAYNDVYANYHGWTVQQIFKNSFGGTPPLDTIWMYMNPPIRLLKDKDEGRVTKEAKTKKPMAARSQLETWASSTSHTLLLQQEQDDFHHRPKLLRTTSSDDSEDSTNQQTSLRPLKEENELELALDELRNDVVGIWEELTTFVSRFICVIPEEQKHTNLFQSHESGINMEQHLDVRTVTSSEANQWVSHVTTFHGTNTEISYNDEEPSSKDYIHTVKQSTKDHVMELRPLIDDLYRLMEELNMNDPSKV